MKNNSQILSWIIGGAIVVALLVIYFAYYSKPTEDSSGLAQAPESTDKANEILAQLRQIKAIDIDTNFFASDPYKSLVDYTVEVPEQNVGRPNPFAPVPGLVIPSLKSTTR